MIILLDFDGTCVEHAFPHIGLDIGAVPVLKKLVEQNHQLVLFTFRGTGPKTDFLSPAVDWFEKNDITLHGVQVTPGQGRFTNSPKPQGDLIIDDIALGIPTKKDSRGYECVDWVEVEKLLIKKNILNGDISNDGTEG